MACVLAQADNKTAVVRVSIPAHPIATVELVGIAVLREPPVNRAFVPAPPLGKPSVAQSVETSKPTAITAAFVAIFAPLEHHAAAVLVLAQADRLLAVVRV
jgi:hypothetical protein